MEKGIEHLETGVGSCGEQTGATHLSEVSREGRPELRQRELPATTSTAAPRTPTPRPQVVQIHTQRKKPEP